MYTVSTQIVNCTCYWPLDLPFVIAMQPAATGVSAQFHMNVVHFHLSAAVASLCGCFQTMFQAMFQTTNALFS